MASHYEHIEQQFDPVAASYLASAVHAQGEDLRHAAPMVTQSDAVLDVGCGAGHLSFALAPHAASVTAYDLSGNMLATVQEEARRRKLHNLNVHQGYAETLPFPENGFDVVCTRLSAHHWTHVPAALAEMWRVLKPDGRILVIDVVGNDDPLVDTHLQAIELIRDPSHVRDYTVAEWKRFFSEAGFSVQTEKSWRIPIDFTSWIARMRTPAAHAELIRTLLANAPDRVRKALGTGNDGSFHLDVQLLAGSKAITPQPTRSSAVPR